MTEHVNDEISLRELLQILLDYKKLILVITCLTIIAAGAFSFYQLREGKNAQLIVAFNFAGIESHHNPDGSNFDPYQIASPYILSEVVQRLNLEDTISPNKVRALIDMSPIIPSAFLTKQAFAMEKNGENINYFPNEYILKVRASVSNGISAGLAQRIANEIVLTYRDYFNDTYLSQKPVANKLVAFDTDAYDYADISSVFHSQLDDIQAYVTAHSSLDPDFRSKRTGMIFDDIYHTVAILDEVEMNRLDSLISAYKLTKDRERLIIYYDYLIEQLSYEKGKYAAQTSVTTGVLANIEDSSSDLIASLTGNISADDGDSYFNNLILKTASLGKTASSLQKQIDFYTSEVEELRSGNYVVSYDEALITAKAMEMINHIEGSLFEWIEITNDTSSEFYDQYLTSAFYALSPAEVYSDVNLQLNIAIGGVLGLMLGVFAAFFKAFWLQSNREKEANYDRAS